MLESSIDAYSNQASANILCQSLQFFSLAGCTATYSCEHQLNGACTSMEPILINPSCVWTCASNIQIYLTSVCRSMEEDCSSLDISDWGTLPVEVELAWQRMFASTSSAEMATITQPTNFLTQSPTPSSPQHRRRNLNSM